MKTKFMLQGKFKHSPWKSGKFTTIKSMDRKLNKLLLDPDYSELKRYAVMDIGKVVGEIVEKK